MSIRVVIAEDQAMVRGALAALLATEGDIEIVGQAQNGREALDLVTQLSPDIVLTDIEMPEVTGLELAAEVKRQHLAVRVVILTTFARAGYLRRALDAGVSGYLLKDAPATTLANAIRRIRTGARVIDPELAAEAWTEADPLTDRERQVLRWRRRQRRGDRRASHAFGRHGAQLSVGGDQQDGRVQPHGGGADRTPKRMAVGSVTVKTF